jgi:hypothetical protein
MLREQIMHIDDFLSRLNRVRRLSGGQYQASCPTAMHEHGDRSAGLQIKAADDGRILVYCFAGCHVELITQALGLTLSDLFTQPERRPGAIATRSPRYLSRDIATCLAYDAATASLALDYAAQGREFSTDDLQAMSASAGRLFRFAQRMVAGL